MEDLILELPNFIPGDLCDHIIEKFENDNRKERGGIVIDEGLYFNRELKNSTDLTITGLKEWKGVNEQLSKYIRNAIKEYYNFLHKNFYRDQPLHMFEGIINAPTRDIGYLIQRQLKGAKYAWHNDGVANLQSFLFIMVYLNTLEPHEGGETEFLNDRKIRPERGKIILFPASWTYPHCGNEVKANAKYILTTFTIDSGLNFLN